MMNQFEITQMWNYTTDQYVDAIIERNFNSGNIHITIHKMFNEAS